MPLASENDPEDAAVLPDTAEPLVAEVRAPPRPKRPVLTNAHQQAGSVRDATGIQLVTARSFPFIVRRYITNLPNGFILEP